MNKDVLVLLLQKDIEELALLTKGFEAMTVFPESLLQLARTKTEHVLKTLHELSNLPPHTINEEMPQLPEAPHTPMPEAPHAPHVSEQAETIFLDVPETTASDNDEHTEPMSHNREETLLQPVGTQPAPPMQTKEETQHKPQHSPIEDPNNGVALNDTLAGQDNSVSNNLANQKIEDIRLAINIGDRFRFQRELFDGNGETLNKTISYLNQLAHYSEAERFLTTKFGWSNDNPHAEEFLRIVKRRYLP